MSDQTIHLVVDLREDRTVTKLREQLAELQDKNEELIQRCNKAEFRLRCEYAVNDQIMDFCREQGIEVPKRLLNRPW